MRLTRLSICSLLFGTVVVAQQKNPELRVNLDNLRYPPLAGFARVEGDVTLEVSAIGQKLVRGNPLLAEVAQANLGTWILPLLAGGKYVIDYHFNLVDPGTKQETVLIGDKFDRFFLRLVGAPTKKVVSLCYHDPALTPLLRQTVLKEDSDVTVNVFVTAQGSCPMTEI